MRFPTNRYAACFLIAIAAIYASSPQAQTSKTTETNELTAVFVCRAETNPQKRLACYDSAVGRFEEAQSKGDLVTISKQQVESVKKDSFGFNIPSIPKLSGLFGGNKSKPKDSSSPKDNPLTRPVEAQKSAERPDMPAKIQPKPDKKTEITELKASIQKTQTFGYKKTRFFLDNGQVWEQIGTYDVRVPKKRNGIAPTAVIQKASLGSFILRINGKGSAVRVKRVR